MRGYVEGEARLVRLDVYSKSCLHACIAYMYIVRYTGSAFSSIVYIHICTFLARKEPLVNLIVNRPVN